MSRSNHQRPPAISFLMVVPRIYVASLADYAAGRLHGRSVDSLDADEIQDAVTAMLKGSPEHGEEWGIYDTEGFGSYNVTVCENDLSKLAAIGAAIVAHGGLFGAFLNVVGDPRDADGVAEAVERFEMGYQGTFDSLSAWAEEHLRDTGTLDQWPEDLRPYFDFEAWARDAELGGDVFTIGAPGGVAVFWGAE